jgi:hypothetical protein
MPLSSDQLRDLLTERSDPARFHPAPEEGLSVRIRRARIRRAAAASLLAGAAVAGAVSAGPLTHDLASRSAPIAAAVSGKQFPASFTASDGTVYRRIAVMSMAAAQPSAAIDVKVGSYPIDVMASCAAPGRDITAITEVNHTYANLLTCPGSPQLTGLSVQPGHNADITFANEALSSGHTSTSWQFAVYEWIPPTIVRPAPAVPQLPASFTGDRSDAVGTTRLSLLGSRSGTWPADRTVTITVPDHGRNFDVVLACSGAIASRLQVTITVDGAADVPLSCTSWTKGQQPRTSMSGGGRAGVPDTMTFRIQAPSSSWAAAYAKRSASWTFAVYQEAASAPQDISSERAMVLAHSTPFRA